MQFKSLDESRVPLGMLQIKSFFIGDEDLRCETASISPHAARLSVFRGNTLEFTYEIYIRRHPRHDFPLIVTEAQTPGGPLKVEVLENGIHLENVREDHVEQHFLYAYRHLCGDR